MNKAGDNIQFDLLDFLLCSATAQRMELNHGKYLKKRTIILRMIILMSLSVWNRQEKGII